MRYTKIVLLSTLSAFALLTASATTSRAFGPSVTDMGVLKPHGAWKVGPIIAQNASYCAMVNQYDKEISLAFARSPAGFGSLAINFPGGILDTGMTYEVILQVDDMEARQFNVRAASPSSLIVQIGQDEDFYSSLGSNGTLHIALPTVDMRFELKKFSNSYISLISCADKLPQHEGPRTAAMPVPPVEKAPLAATQQAYGEATNTAALRTTPSVPSSPAEATLQKSSTELQAEMDAVRQSLHEKGVDAAYAPPVSVAQQKSAGMTGYDPSAAANLNEENIALKSRLAQISPDQTELKNEISLLKAEKDELQSRLSMQDRQSKLLEAALNGKEKDLFSVRSLSVADSKSLANVQAELRNLKSSQSSVVADLQARLATQTARYDVLQKQFTDIKEVGKSAETQTAQSQSELDQTRQHLAQVLAQLAASEQQRNEQAAQMEAQNEQSKTLFESMKQELEKARGQVAMIQNQMMSVSMRKDDLAAQLNSQIKQNKMLQMGLEERQETASSRQEQNMASGYTAMLAAQNDESEYTAESSPPEQKPVHKALTKDVRTSEAYVPPLYSDESSPAAGTGKGNLSSSEKDHFSAITPQVIGQNNSSLLSLAPLLKPSASGMGSSSSPADQNWETVVVQ